MGLLLEVSKHVDGYIEFDGILDRIVELKEMLLVQNEPLRLILLQ